MGIFLKLNVLLLGGSGTLGKNIIKSKKFKKLKYPSKKKLNIKNKNQVYKYFYKNKINLVLHCAAVARVRECEKNKKNAYRTNVIGTSNIVQSILKIRKLYNRDIKLIFLSSDAVYPSTKGNYKETDKISHYNYYGYTKIKGEKIVRKLKNYIIIRTRFFNKNKIPFNYSATNIFTSALEVKELVQYISLIVKKNFQGVINVGRSKISDYNQYKKYKKNLKPCDKKRIFDEIEFKIATDASLNLSKLNKIL